MRDNDIKTIYNLYSNISYTLIGGQEYTMSRFTFSQLCFHPSPTTFGDVELAPLRTVSSILILAFVFFSVTLG